MFAGLSSPSPPQPTGSRPLPFSPSRSQPWNFFLPSSSRTADARAHHASDINQRQMISFHGLVLIYQHSSLSRDKFRFQMCSPVFLSLVKDDFSNQSLAQERNFREMSPVRPSQFTGRNTGPQRKWKLPSYELKIASYRQRQDWHPEILTPHPT